MNQNTNYTGFMCCPLRIKLWKIQISWVFSLALLTILMRLDGFGWKLCITMISLCENVQGSTLLYLWRKNHFAAHFGDMKRMGIWNWYYLACNLDSQMNTRLCRMIVILPSLLEIISTLYHCGGTWMLLPSLVTPPVRLVVSFCTLKLCNKIFYIL